MVHFLKEYLVNPKTTGAICPSSSYLAEAMTGDETLISSSRCVVELGPGTGAITEKILTKISQDCTFFSLEINPLFSAKLKEKFPDATVYSDSAENIQKYLEKHNAKECNTIISSLPWTFLDQQTQRKIFESMHNSLSKDGKVVTYSYLHGLLFPSGRRFRNLLNQHFPNIQKKIVWKNIPPAVVYECRK